MDIRDILDQLKSSPETIQFQDVMEMINTCFTFKPTAFKNGEIENKAEDNQGSCKIFAFARHVELNKDKTLALFGDYYRKDVLGNPNGTDHANIRNFMKYGWEGIEMNERVLEEV